MNIETARTQMIEQQVRACEVPSPDVLRVLGQVQREHFVPGAYQALAFADTGIPIGHGQYMMTPQVEGRALQALDIGPADRVLEIGTGSGYLSACLGLLGGELTSLEIFPDLAERARRSLHAAGGRDCRVLTADAFNWRPEVKYSRIVLTGSLPEYDARFEDWLEYGGRLFAIVGAVPVMEALLVRMDSTGHSRRDSLFETQIGPLLNATQPARFRF